MESWSGGKERARGLARRSRRRRARMARRMRGRSGARRQHRADAAPQTPARRGRRKAPERRRRYERTIRAVATITRESAADFRKQGRGRSESAWTAKRQGVKAIWRLPNPRDARRNMRLRKSLDRRKSDAPAPHTARTHTARGSRGRADAAATGGEGNLAIAEPPWRKAQRAPAQEPRPPETGRAYPRHTPHESSRRLTDYCSMTKFIEPQAGLWHTISFYRKQGRKHS